MNMIPVLLFCISASLDNLAISIAYGLKKITIPKIINVIIAMISALGTFLAMVLGKLIIRFFPLWLSNILGASILLILGVYFLLDFFKSIKKSKIENLIFNQEMAPSISEVMCKRENSELKDILKFPEKADMDNSGFIDKKEALTLGLALSLNNMGLGVGASVSGLYLWETVLFSFIFSLVFVRLGYIISNGFLGSLLGKYSSLISSLIILSLGLYQMFL